MHHEQPCSLNNKCEGWQQTFRYYKRFKEFHIRYIRKALEADIHESRRAWLLWMMKRAGNKNERNKDFQFWQQHNHPIELDTNEMLDQRLDYIHNNPVKAGLVEEAHYWMHSSARDYSETGRGRIEIIFL